MMANDCTCPNDGLSDFDRGMSQSMEGALLAMPDQVTILTVSIPCTVSDRTLAQVNAQGGKKSEVVATLNMFKADFLKAGCNILGGDLVTFSDGQVGKISKVDDADGPVLTIYVGPRLEGSAGPNGGKW